MGLGVEEGVDGVANKEDNELMMNSYTLRGPIIHTIIIRNCIADTVLAMSWKSGADCAEIGYTEIGFI